MAVLVTRPYPDNEATAAKLRARGLEVLLAPMLRFEPTAFHDEPGTRYDAVVVTSSNALRALAPQFAETRLLHLPLFAVGEQTAATARAIGFAKVVSADGDALALQGRLIESVRARQLKKTSRLLYLAGAELSRDLAGELDRRGFRVETRPTYRMVALPTLPRDACEAFATGGLLAVLHYSRRSAAAFVEAVRTDGIEISALAVAQCCMSANIGAVLREAGAMQVMASATPDENALFEVLDRALRLRMA
ncbi:MAG: uroporphyrinogen-III synthase [Bradyrhizobium sp.]